MKGVAGNLSFADLYQAASALSDVLHDGDLAAARTAYPAAVAGYDGLTEELEFDREP